jgi:uncharacterized protein YdbL (DUF1318 family)
MDIILSQTLRNVSGGDLCRGWRRFRFLKCSPVALATLFVVSGPMPEATAQYVEQQPQLFGTGAVGNAQQGYSVAVSADGRTAAVAGNADNRGWGAVWVFTRSNGAWTQQGDRLVGTGANAPNPPVRRTSLLGCAVCRRQYSSRRSTL